MSKDLEIAKYFKVLELYSVLRVPVTEAPSAVNAHSVVFQGICGLTNLAKSEASWPAQSPYTRGRVTFSYLSFAKVTRSTAIQSFSSSV